MLSNSIAGSGEADYASMHASGRTEIVFVYLNLCICICVFVFVYLYCGGDYASMHAWGHSALMQN